MRKLESSRVALNIFFPTLRRNRVEKLGEKKSPRADYFSSLVFFSLLLLLRGGRSSVKEKPPRQLFPLICSLFSINFIVDNSCSLHEWEEKKVGSREYFSHFYNFCSQLFLPSQELEKDMRQEKLEAFVSISQLPNLPNLPDFFSDFFLPAILPIIFCRLLLLGGDRRRRQSGES